MEQFLWGLIGFGAVWLAFFIWNGTKRKWYVHYRDGDFGDETDTIRAHTEAGAKRIAKRTMYYHDYEGFSLRKL